MNALGYIRISDKDQSVYSLDYQERVIREYCTRNQVQVVGLFKDDGESSYTFDRPDWLALEAFIRKNRNFDYLVIMDYDRFSRNLGEALMKIKELEGKLKIKVRATSDAFDIDFTDPANFMMRAFKLMLAESELHRIRQRTKSGMVQAALNGRYVSRAPWGYVNSKDDQSKPLLKVDEEKAFIVRMIFKEYNRGIAIEQIRKLVIPYGYTQSGNSAIRDILSNPVYAGMVRVPAHQSNPEKIIKALHPAIVSEQEFWNVQARLNSKAITVQQNEDVPLRGILKHSCGKIMTAGNSKGRDNYYWYYVCHSCKVNVPARTLHSKLNEILDIFSFDQDTLQEFSDAITENIKDHLLHKSELVAQTQKALRIIQDKISLAEEKYLQNHLINKATYNKVNSKFLSQQADLQRRLYELNSDQDFYFDKLKRLLPKLHDLRSTYEALDLHTKQLFLSAVFDNSLMVENGTYRTTYLDPIFAHNELELKEKNLLIIQQASGILPRIPLSAPWRSPVQMMLNLYDILVA